MQTTSLMRLEALAAAAPRLAADPVPDWIQGAYARRAILFADGVEDDRARCVRLQSQTLAAELWAPASRPDVSDRAGLHDCSGEELLGLAAVEGWAADTAWLDGGLVRTNPCGFQPCEALPAPGELRRVGPSLTEFAPDGAWRADWRLQSASAGLSVALRLMFETGADGLTRPRDGALILSGEHGLFVLGRRRPLMSMAPVQEQMRAGRDPAAFAETAFDGEVSYVRRGPSGDWRGGPVQQSVPRGRARAGHGRFRPDRDHRRPAPAGRRGRDCRRAAMARGDA